MSRLAIRLLPRLYSPAPAIRSPQRFTNCYPASKSITFRRLAGTTADTEPVVTPEDGKISSEPVTADSEPVVTEEQIPTEEATTTPSTEDQVLAEDKHDAADSATTIGESSEERTINIIRVLETAKEREERELRELILKKRKETDARKNARNKINRKALRAAEAALNAAPDAEITIRIPRVETRHGLLGLYNVRRDEGTFNHKMVRLKDFEQSSKDYKTLFGSLRTEIAEQRLGVQYMHANMRKFFLLQPDQHVSFTRNLDKLLVDTLRILNRMRSDFDKTENEYRGALAFLRSQGARRESGQTGTGEDTLTQVTELDSRINSPARRYVRETSAAPFMSGSAPLSFLSVNKLVSEKKKKSPGWKYERPGELPVFGSWSKVETDDGTRRVEDFVVKEEGMMPNLSSWSKLAGEEVSAEEKNDVEEGEVESVTREKSAAEVGIEVDEGVEFEAKVKEGEGVVEEVSKEENSELQQETILEESAVEPGSKEEENSELQQDNILDESVLEQETKEETIELQHEDISEESPVEEAKEDGEQVEVTSELPQDNNNTPAASSEAVEERAEETSEIKLDSITEPTSEDGEQKKH